VTPSPCVGKSGLEGRSLWIERASTRWYGRRRSLDNVSVAST